MSGLPGPGRGAGEAEAAGGEGALALKAPGGSPVGPPSIDTQRPICAGFARRNEGSRATKHENTSLAGRASINVWGGNGQRGRKT